MIYLDSAATSYYRPREVAQAVYDAILTMGNAGRGSHTSSLNSARMIYETRCLLNELFHGPGPAFSELLFFPQFLSSPQPDRDSFQSLCALPASR